MALDREKILQAAQKHVDKKRFDKAVEEYKKIVQEDPNDARTLLKIGDLQARMGAYAEAIGTYDRVGQFYSGQGFSLKAIAVYKQIRELIKKHVPQLEDKYAHIIPKLAQIYTELGLTTDALAAYDEVATRLQRGGRDRDAIEVFRKMVALDSTNPLPHLRLAEACCRIQSVDEAINSFWMAAELLIRLKRRDDALKVIERILHFRQDARYAKVAAELYLERGEPQDGMQALAKLQLCFQLDPKNLDVLSLLSRAFIAIGQESKAIEVKKEMARLAQDMGRDDVFREVLRYLNEVAPNDEQVRALVQNPMSQRPASSSFIDDAELIEPSVRPPENRTSLRPSIETSVVEDADFDEFDFDEEPMSQALVPGGAPKAGATGRRTVVPTGPDVLVADDEIRSSDGFVEPDSVDAVNAEKAILDADSFRSLRLYDKAIETLQMAIELEPQSPQLREKLRDVLFDVGDRDAAIGEMISIAQLYLELGEQEKAERELYEILDAEPGHVAAVEMLEQLGLDPGPQIVEPYTVEHDTTTAVVLEPDLLQPYDPDAPLPSYDLEGMPVARAIVDTPFDGTELAQEVFGVGREGPLPSFPLRADDVVDEDVEEISADYDGPAVNPINPNVPKAGALPDFSQEGVEEVLEEVEFFISRGLADDARGILSDALERYPNHPLLLEKLSEVDGGDDAQSGTHERSGLEEGAGDDHAFDIAASLDALDVLEIDSSHPPSEVHGVEQVDVDQVFAKFKEGVRAQVSESDSSTHYDLGVAYKEMGLLPDAINEFSIAAKDPKFECTCQAMIGMIHLEQGNLDEAADAYIAGLAAQKKSIDQEMSLYYDLGIVYEMKGSNAEALYYLQKIARRDPGYRDVKERIEALRPSMPPAKTAAGHRALGNGDELDAAFDDLIESK